MLGHISFSCPNIYYKSGYAFHDLYRGYLINGRFAKESRPVVINNWEATYMNFDTDKLCQIIDSVKNTGIDTFVLDDEELQCLAEQILQYKKIENLVLEGDLYR